MYCLCRSPTINPYHEVAAAHPRWCDRPHGSAIVSIFWPCGVRRELAGNLCRCTGYAGIGTAVCSVLKEATTEERLAAQATNVGASGMASPALISDPVTATVPVTSGVTTFTPRPSEPSGQCRVAAPSHASFAPRAGWNRFEESFEVHEPPL